MIDNFLHIIIYSMMIFVGLCVTVPLAAVIYTEVETWWGSR